MHCNADVHRTRVRRDEEDAAPQEPCENAEADLPRKDVQALVVPIPHLCAATLDNLHIHRPAHDGNVIAAREVGIRHLRKVFVHPPLRQPACADVERDHPVLRREMRRPEARRFLLCRRGEPHLEPCIRNLVDYARRAQCRIVRVNLVHHHMLIGTDMVKEEREAGLCIADDVLAAAEYRERGGALVAVEIDDEIVFLFPQMPCKAQDAEEAAVFPLLVDQETFVDVPILLHDVREFRVREQGDARLGIVLAQRVQHGRHKHQIAEVHEVDDENVSVQTYSLPQANTALHTTAKAAVSFFPRPSPA